MLQLENQTPFAVALMTMPDLDGIDAVVVAVKATFTLTYPPRLGDDQVPVHLESVYHGDPGQSSPRLLSECHLCKPASDIVLQGQARAPGGKPVAELLVGLSVGALEKTVRVIGDRWFLDGMPTRPQPFAAMPLVYERAFGGTVDARAYEPRNPFGRGFFGKKAAPEEAPLPNLEDPAAPYQPGRTVPVAGFGWIDAAWSPRKTYAGTYDRVWEKARMPYLPEDFDPRFFNAAHPDLVYRGFLEGGEPVTLINLMSERPRLDFYLPTCRLEASAVVGRRREPVSLALETLFLEPEETRFCLTWRGLVRCPEGAQAMRRLDLALAEMKIA